MREEEGSKNDNQLRREIWSVIVMREEETKERRWIEKRNSQCDYYDRIRRIKRRMINWKVKWDNMIIMREEESTEQ
jgi:hypothetical protein